MLTLAMRNALEKLLLASGRLAGLYRRLCRPSGDQWARYLRRHGH